jgi:hypothetical protein
VAGIVTRELLSPSATFDRRRECARDHDTEHLAGGQPGLRRHLAPQAQQHVMSAAAVPVNVDLE